MKVFGGLHPTPGTGVPITKLTPNLPLLGTLVAPVALLHPCPSSCGSDQSQLPNGLWWKTNPLLLFLYLFRTGEFHCRAVCFVNWNIFLLFKHIPWRFPALMSASLQLSRFLSWLIFYFTSQTTKQPFNFPAKPLQSQTTFWAFITFAAASLGAGIRDRATFPVSHSGASHWSEELQGLSGFSQPLHVLGDLLGGVIGGGLCLFLFFPSFFFFAIPRDWHRNIFPICKSKMLYGASSSVLSSLRDKVWDGGRSPSQMWGLHRLYPSSRVGVVSGAGIFHTSSFPSILTPAFLKIIFLKKCYRRTKLIGVINLFPLLLSA